MNMTPVVKQLLILNIIFFIGSQMVPVAYDLLALHYPEFHKFQYWQLITHMFMHAKMPNLMHIVFNMMGLVMFGSPLEHFWGGKKFLFFYISCGLGAALIHLGVGYYHYQHGLNILLENGYNNEQIVQLLQKEMFDTEWQKLLSPDEFTNFASSFITETVGASGAIYGLLTAFAFMFPNAELMLLFIPFPIKAKYFVPGLVVMDLFSGVTGISIFGGGIAHFAHVGGALFGFVMMMMWRNNKFNQNRWN